MIAVRNVCALPGVGPDSFGSLFAELGNAVGEPRDFPAGGIAMDDALARGTHECRLGFSHGGGCRGAVAGRNRLLDLPHGTAHAGAPRLIDHGAAGDLTS